MVTMDLTKWYSLQHSSVFIPSAAAASRGTHVEVGLVPGSQGQSFPPIYGCLVKSKSGTIPSTK